MPLDRHKDTVLYCILARVSAMITTTHGTSPFALRILFPSILRSPWNNSLRTLKLDLRCDCMVNSRCGEELFSQLANFALQTQNRQSYTHVNTMLQWSHGPSTWNDYGTSPFALRILFPSILRSPWNNGLRTLKFIVDLSCERTIFHFSPLYIYTCASALNSKQTIVYTCQYHAPIKPWPLNLKWLW
jgi:hypothetical protein